MLFNLGNLLYWILLGVGISLFVMAIVTGGGDEDIDLDLDADMDVDVDVDVDVDADVDGDVDADADIDSNFGIMQLLSWLGVGRVPLIFLLAIDFSLWGFLGWILNVSLNIPTGFLAIAVLLGSMVLSLLMGRVISQPVGHLFASFGEETSSDRLIGCIGTVSSAIIDRQKLGQVDVRDRHHNLVTITAKLPEWATEIPKRGDSVIIIDRQPENYFVIAENSRDREEWLGNTPNINKP